MTKQEILFLKELNDKGFDTIFEHGTFIIEKDDVCYVNIDLIEESSGKITNPIYKLVKNNLSQRLEYWESQTTNEAELPSGDYQYIVNNIYIIIKEY